MLSFCRFFDSFCANIKHEVYIRGVYFDYVLLIGPQGIKLTTQPTLTQDSGIVIIDDEPSVTELARDTLREIGFKNVVTYTSVKKLTEESKVAEAQLVFIDVNLQGTSGLILLAWFKNKYPEKHIVMFSGDTRKALVSEAKSLGACSFLSKVELNKNIRQLLNKWQIKYPIDAAMPQGRQQRRHTIEPIIN